MLVRRNPGQWQPRLNPPESVFSLDLTMVKRYVSCLGICILYTVLGYLSPLLTSPAQGLRLGHEPDSAQFSTLGGWVATRASGMKKNMYGNIEDLVVDVKVVTPSGTIEKSCLVPRISAGPDVTELVLGSEGTLGVITEVVLRLHRLAPVCTYGSIIFPNFRSGVCALQEIAQTRGAPAALRLVDNAQFQFSHALKPRSGTPVRTAVLDYMQKMYVTKLKGFNPDEMAAATICYEVREPCSENLLGPLSL